MRSGETRGTTGPSIRTGAAGEDWTTAPGPLPAARGAAFARSVGIDLSVTVGLIGGLMLVASQIG